MTLRWTIPFVSLNGTSCHIDIYSATGSTQPTVTLKGGAVPFEYEEDTSQNLLEFVRIKTGNINIMEETDGALSALMPTTETDRPVAVYYGSDLIFTGFIQCAEFSNPFTAAPREMSFPVVSPMGLLGSYDFAATAPSRTTIGALLKTVLNAINPFGYTNVIYPGTSLSPWDNIIRTTAICPLNEDFKKDYQNTSQALADLYRPKTYLYFIEGLCAALGWMVHDTPGGPVFVDYGNLGNFSQVTVSSLDNPSSRTGIQAYQMPFDSFYNNRDNNADYSVQRPLEEIKYSADGERPTEIEVTADYSIKSGNSFVDPTERWMYYIMINCYPGLYNHAGFIVQSTSWGADDTSISWSTFWGSQGTDLRVTLVSCIPVHTLYNALLKIDLSIGDHFSDLQGSGWGSNITGGVRLRVGGKTLKRVNGALTMVSDDNASIAIEFDGSTGRLITSATIPNEFNDCDGLVIPLAGSGCDQFADLYLEVDIVNPGNKYMKADIKLMQNNLPDVSFPSEFTIRGSNTFGVGSASIKANLNNLSSVDNSNSFANSNGQFASYDPPAFAYMFGTRRFIRQKVAKGSGDGYHPTPPNPYIPRWYYYGSDTYGRYRVIAESFNPVDDEYELTLAQAGVLSS